LTMNSNILAPLALLLVASALLVSSAPASYPSSVDTVVPETGLSTELTVSSRSVIAKPAAKTASKLTRKSTAVSKPASQLTRKSTAVSKPAPNAVSLKLSPPAIIVTEAMCCKGLRKETVEGAIEMCNDVAQKENFCRAFTPPTACEQCFQTFCVDNASKQSFKTQCAAITAAKKGKIADEAEEVNKSANKMERSTMKRSTEKNTRYHNMEVKEKAEAKAEAKAKAASLTHS